jgi:hypothetical protein
MVKRLDWEKSRFAGKPKLGVKDEAENVGRDQAARWLERREAWLATQQKLKHSRNRRRRAR